MILHVFRARRSLTIATGPSQMDQCRHVCPDYKARGKSVKSFPVSLYYITYLYWSSEYTARYRYIVKHMFAHFTITTPYQLSWGPAQERGDTEQFLGAGTCKHNAGYSSQAQPA